MGTPTPWSRDSGNDFWVPEIGSDNGPFSFIFFSFPHVVSSCLFKQMLVLGTDFHFWSWLGLTRNGNVKSRIKSRSYFACVPLPLSTSNCFVSSHSGQIWHYTSAVSGCFYWIWRGTKSFLCRISKNREPTKVVSTISALKYYTCPQHKNHIFPRFLKHVKHIQKLNYALTNNAYS